MGRVAATFLFLLTVVVAAAVMPPCEVIRSDAYLPGADSIRGPWEWRGNDVFFELVRTPASDGYDFVLLDSFDADVPFARPKGQLKALADTHRFDLYLESESKNGRRRLEQAFIASFSSDWSRVTFHAYNRHRRLTLERLFPYIFRLALTNDSPRPNDIEGAINLNLSRQEGEIVL